MIARLLFLLISLLPLGVVRSLGGFTGWLMWRFDSRGCSTARINIALCFDDMSEVEQAALVRASMIETGRTGLELVKVLMQPRRRTAKRILAVNNQALVDDMVASTRGVLLLFPHLANWEVIGVWCDQHRMDLHAMYQPPRQDWLDPIMRKAREDNGSSVYPTDTGGVRSLLKALKAGSVVGILPDQEPEEDGGVFAPFFGTPALTMTLVQKLARRTQCAVVMCAVRRVPGGFEIDCEAVDPDIASDDTARSTEIMNTALEQAILRAPTQYQWEYKRFKKRNDGGPKRYSF